METFLRIAALIVGNIIGFSGVILAVRWYERRRRIAYERAMKRCSRIKFGIDFCNTRSQTVYKIVEKKPSGFEVVAEERFLPQPLPIELKEIAV